MAIKDWTNLEAKIRAAVQMKNDEEPMTLLRLSRKLRRSYKDILEVVDGSYDYDLCVAFRTGLGIGELPTGEWTVEYIGGK